jgi:ABC-type antimicrobial peptide transport system permease subunit
MIYSVIVAILTSGVVFVVEILCRTIFEPNVNEFLTHFLALDNKLNFEIMRFSPVVFLIFVAIFVVGVFASSLPLIVNTRRSPLKNLRSE